jgi:hypothetical protein
MQTALRTLFGTAATFALFACSQGRKDAALPDSAATLAASYEENPSCAPTAQKYPGQAFVFVYLDSEAVGPNRLLVTAIRDSGQPLHARLQATSGGVECRSESSGIEFKLRGPQSYLAVVIHSPTAFVAVNTRRIEDRSMISGRAYSADGEQAEMVWAGGVESIKDERDKMLDRVASELEDQRNREPKAVRIEPRKRPTRP